MSELLEKVVADSLVQQPYKMGETEQAICEELDKYLGPGILGDNHTIIYKEFKPMKDTFEYTLYFKITGFKMRADFEIDGDKLEKMDQAALYNECLLAILDVILYTAETWELKLGDMRTREV